jgi:hypothetical protein
MQTKAALMVLVLLSGTIAGCTSDPDGGGNDGIDSDALDDLFDEYFQDFVNNTSITVINHYHNNTTYVVDDGDYSSSNTVHHHYNNTTINEGDETSTNNYNNQTEYDYSAMNYSWGAGNGSGSGNMMYLLDMEFTLLDLMPELALLDHRNDSIDYWYSYYDYLTNSQRTDLFTIQCSDYYIVGSQSSNNNSQVTYWQDNDNYWDAWVDQYNQTVANMLQDASSDSNVRQTCDENYDSYLADYIHLIDLPIPAGMAISRSEYYRMALHPTHQVWCAVDSNGYAAGYSYPDVGVGSGSVYTICEYDWYGYGDGWNDDWYDREYTVYGELDWGLEYYSQLPAWIGGDGVTELPLYVQGINSEIQYRIVLYFELVSLVNFEE